MIKVVAALMGLALVVSVGVASVLPSGNRSKDSVAPQVLILNKANTLVLNGTVTQDSMAQLTSQVLKMSHELPNNQVINLVLYTPGGDVSAGSSFIDAINALPQKVNTLTLFSASMGFHIVQHASGMRYILPSGTLMSHRAKGGVEGEFHGSINTRLAWIYQQLTDLEVVTAHRMGLDLNDYRKLIKDEYWVSGSQAQIQNAADQIVTATCDKSLSGTQNVIVPTLFGNATLTMSSCPLITAPIGLKFELVDKSKQSDLAEYFQTLYNDPAGFTADYIETDKYKNIVK